MIHILDKLLIGGALLIPYLMIGGALIGLLLPGSGGGGGGDRAEYVITVAQK